MPQSLHYINKEYERKDAEDWMVRVKEEVGEELAREKMILTWRQENSFIDAEKLYPLLNNRYLGNISYCKVSRQNMYKVLHTTSLDFNLWSEMN